MKYIVKNDIEPGVYFNYLKFKKTTSFHFVWMVNDCTIFNKLSIIVKLFRIGEIIKNPYIKIIIVE